MGKNSITNNLKGIRVFILTKQIYANRNNPF